MAREPITDPLMAHFAAKLEGVRSAGAMDVVFRCKDFAEAAAAVLRDNRNRILELERQAKAARQLDEDGVPLPM